MKYGRTEGKKIVLHADIGGNVDQNELWAILDSVDSDVAEEEIDNLMIDRDTEFETITDDAAALMESSQGTDNVPLITDNSLEAVVHTDLLKSATSDDAPSCSKDSETMMNKDQVGTIKTGIDFKLASMRPENEITKPRAALRRGVKQVSDCAKLQSSTVEPVSIDDSGVPPKRTKKDSKTENAKHTDCSNSDAEKSVDFQVEENTGKNDAENEQHTPGSSKPSSKTKTPVVNSKNRRKTIDVDQLRSSKKKANDVPKTCQLSNNISFQFDGNVDVENPIKLFYQYSDFSELCRTATESIRYALQKGRRFTCTDQEIEVFIGVTYFMGLIKLPSLRDYWRTDDLGVSFGRNAMPRDRYEEIRANLHFSNNMDPTRADDKAGKIRSLIEHFNMVYQRNSTSVSHQSIDEHLVKFKGHHSMEQYVKNKLIKWGFKFWLRCDALTGYLYEFDIYTGRKDAPELGLGENVVMDLTKKLDGSGASVFADNCFSSPA